MVVVRSGLGNLYAAPVDRTTKTLVIVNGSKYRKNEYEYSRKIGASTWSNGTIHIPKEGQIDELMESMRRDKMVAELRDVNWNVISTDKIDAAYSILCRA